MLELKQRKIPFDIAKISKLRKAGQRTNDLKSSVSNFLKVDTENIEILSSNMNYVIRVKDFLGTQSIILKVTPENGSLSRFPDIQLSEERILFDLNFYSVCSGLTPKILYSSPKDRFFIMEDLGRLLLREYIRNGDYRVSDLDKMLKTFAVTLAKFYKRFKKYTRFKNNPLIKEHYNHIFCYPTQNPLLVNSIWYRCGLQEENIKALQFWQKKILELKIKKINTNSFTRDNSSNVFIHGDLHTGSIILSNEKMKLIDGEFTHCGPVSFDIGMFLANLYIDLAISLNTKYINQLKGSFLDNFVKVYFYDKENSKEKTRFFREVKEVKLHELIRQSVGVSFVIDPLNYNAREIVYKEIKNIIG